MMEVRYRSTCEIFDGSLSKFAKFAWHLRANASIMLVAYVTTFSSHRSFSSSYLRFLFAFGMMLGRLNATPLLLLCILSPFSTLSHGCIFALPCAFSQQLKHPCRIFTCKVGEGPFCTPVHVGFGSASINSCYHLRDDGIRTPSRPFRVCQRPHLPCLHHGSKKKKTREGGIHPRAFECTTSNAPLFSVRPLVVLVARNVAGVGGVVLRVRGSTAPLSSAVGRRDVVSRCDATTCGTSPVVLPVS